MFRTVDLFEMNDTIWRLNRLWKKELLVSGFSVFKGIFTKKLAGFGQNPHLKGGQRFLIEGGVLSDDRRFAAPLFA